MRLLTLSKIFFSLTLFLSCARGSSPHPQMGQNPEGNTQEETLVDANPRENGDTETSEATTAALITEEPVLAPVEKTQDTPLAENPQEPAGIIAASQENAAGIIFDDLTEIQNGGGATVGNGGNALVCLKLGTKEISSVSLLDYYEAQNRWDFTISLGDKTLSVDEKIELVLTRLAKFDPNRADDYRKQAAEFSSNTNFWPGVRLRAINDANIIGLPSGCVVSQIARQMEPEVSSDKYFVIAKDLFDLMDTDQKAGLILHEIIYREFISRGHTQSPAARHFNALLSSEQFAQLNLMSYLKQLQTNKLSFVYKKIFPIDLDAPFHIITDNSDALGGAILIDALELKRNGYRITIPAGGSVKFYPSGLVASAITSNFKYALNNFSAEYYEQGTPNNLELSFDETERLKEARIAKPYQSESFLHLATPLYRYISSKYFDLRNDGSIQNVSPENTPGNFKLFSAYCETSFGYMRNISFHSNGALKNIYSCNSTLRMTDLGYMSSFPDHQLALNDQEIVLVSTGTIIIGQPLEKRQSLPDLLLGPNELLIDATHLNFERVISIRISAGNWERIIEPSTPWTVIPKGSEEIKVEYIFDDASSENNPITEYLKIDALTPINKEGVIPLYPMFHVASPNIMLDPEIVAKARNIELVICNGALFHSRCTKKYFSAFPENFLEDFDRSLIFGVNKRVDLDKVSIKMSFEFPESFSKNYHSVTFLSEESSFADPIVIEEKTLKFSELDAYRALEKSPSLGSDSMKNLRFHYETNPKSPFYKKVLIVKIKELTIFDIARNTLESVPLNQDLSGVSYTDLDRIIQFNQDFSIFCVNETLGFVECFNAKNLSLIAQIQTPIDDNEVRGKPLSVSAIFGDRVLAIGPTQDFVVFSFTEDKIIWESSLPLGRTSQDIWGISEDEVLVATSDFYGNISKLNLKALQISWTQKTQNIINRAKLCLNEKNHILFLDKEKVHPQNAFDLDGNKIDLAQTSKTCVREKKPTIKNGFLPLDSGNETITGWGIKADFARVIPKAYPENIDILGSWNENPKLIMITVIIEGKNYIYIMEKRPEIPNIQD